MFNSSVVQIITISFPLSPQPYLFYAKGSRASFCIYGLLSGCVLAGFLYVRKKASELVDEEVKIDDSEALGGYGAPQGVPSAIPVQTTTATTQDIDYQW